MVGVHLVGQLALGLLGLVLVALAAQELEDLLLLELAPRTSGPGLLEPRPRTLTPARPPQPMVPADRLQLRRAKIRGSPRGSTGRTACRSPRPTLSTRPGRRARWW